MRSAVATTRRSNCPTNTVTTMMTTPTANQIGYFRGSGSLETSATPISNSVDLLAEAVVLNYLALHNDTASFEAALPNFGLPASARAALTAFETIR